MARIVLTWAGLYDLATGGDSTVSLRYHFPPLIFVADLIRGTSAWRLADDWASPNLLCANPWPWFE